MLEDSKEAPETGDPVNINIVKKDYNKENIANARAKPRPPPAVGEDIYENIEVQDINSKLSRL